jgi:hypothetical protein
MRPDCTRLQGELARGPCRSGNAGAVAVALAQVGRQARRRLSVSEEFRQTLLARSRCVVSPRASASNRSSPSCASLGRNTTRRRKAVPAMRRGTNIFGKRPALTSEDLPEPLAPCTRRNGRAGLGIGLSAAASPWRGPHPGRRKSARARTRRPRGPRNGACVHALVVDASPRVASQRRRCASRSACADESRRPPRIPHRWSKEVYAPMNMPWLAKCRSQKPFKRLQLLRLLQLESFRIAGYQRVRVCWLR